MHGGAEQLPSFLNGGRASAVFIPLPDHYGEPVTHDKFSPEKGWMALIDAVEKNPRSALELSDEILTVLSTDDVQSLEYALATKIASLKCVDVGDLRDSDDVRSRDVVRSAIRLITKIRFEEAMSEIEEMHKLGHVGDDEYLGMCVALAQKMKGKKGGD